MHLLRSFLLILLFVGGAYAQTYDFKDIGKNKKIPAKYIYDIQQGENQKLYLGTENGLFSYNGSEFDHLVKSKEDIVNVLKVDNKLVYQGYFDGKLGVYDLKSKNQAIFQSQFESKIIEIEIFKGEVLVLIQGEGLFKFVNEEFLPISIYNIESSEITSLKSSGDIILVSTNSELISLELNNKKWGIKQSIKKYEEKFPIKIEFKNSIVFGVLCNDLSVEIYKYDGEMFNSQSTVVIKDLETRPSDLFFGADNQLWISTINEGIIKVSSPDSSFLSFNTSFFNTSNGLAGNEIKSVFSDNQGVLWIGHYGKGITNLVSEQVVLYENINGVNLNNVNCIDQDESKGVVYLGHNSGVWQIQFGSTIVIDSIALPEVNLDVKALCFDDKNTLWIGTAENGLYQYDTKTGVITSDVDLFGMEVLYINRISFNKWNQNVYISTDLGLYFFDNNKDILSKLTTNDGLAHNVLNDVLPLKSGEIWFAANGSPIFSLKNNELSVHKDLEGLTSYSAYCMKESSGDRILVGTESDGLVILKNEQVESKIDDQNGLLDNTVFDIVELEDGKIWTFHKSAITILNNELKQIRSFAAEGDLFDVDLTKNGVHSSNSKYIWVACNKGLLRILKAYNETSIPPSIEISEIIINDKVVSKIPEYFVYGSYSFYINFLGIDLNNSTEIEYEYYLEGLESGWKKYSYNHNFASYPKLADGEYIFKVRAKNKWGQYSAEVQIPFTIEIPYWKSWWFIILVPAFILLMIFLFFQYRLIRVRKQKFHLETVVRDRTFELRLEKDNLSKAKMHIEHKNQEITDSINYAEKIQNAILPDITDETILKEKDAFLFYRPCDIVSGDFYWINYVDDKQIIVVADCTGHGVPGAFMSLISSTLIDKIVFDLGVTDPEEMVKLLDSNIEQVLKTKDSSTKDGIDIGIISIDRKNNIVDYCGASRPLYIVKEGELEVYKGGMLAIGDYYDNIVKEYVTHRINIEKNTLLYLSSDGFPDQFGGLKDRKYMVGKFKKFLVSIGHHDMNTQKTMIEKEFDRWKGNSSQTDDVLVIGVKL